MNKKKITALVASLGLVACIGVGATLAYFTDSDKTENVVTMGNVDITLTEPNWSYGEDGIKNVVPNQTISKDPTITLSEGSRPAYVKARVDYVLDGKSLSEKEISEIESTLNINSKLWVKGADGSYYCQQPLKNAGDSVVLFTSVTIPATWGNEIAGKVLNINVSAEAVQYENFTPVYNELHEIVGWDVPTALN